MHELSPDSEQSYICKIASMEELEAKWTYEIEKNADDPDWPIWKKQAFERTEKGQSIPYYGILNGQIITEATALLDEAIVQNSCGLVDDKTAYLSAFRTVEAYQGQGYFSKLFGFMLGDLKKRGYERVTLGVEPGEITNMLLYFHYGFTEYVKTGIETYPSGKQIDVIYYAKKLSCSCLMGNYCEGKR